MRAYSFDRFRRDYRNVGKPSLPLRLYGWLSRMDFAIPLNDETRQAMAESCRVADAVGAAMSPAERANPRNMTESRRLELADAAKVSDEELAATLSAYDWFAKTFPERAESAAIDTAFFLGVPLLILGAAVLLAMICVSLVSR